MIMTDNMAVKLATLKSKNKGDWQIITIKTLKSTIHKKYRRGMTQITLMLQDLPQMLRCS